MRTRVLNQAGRAPRSVLKGPLKTACRLASCIGSAAGFLLDHDDDSGLVRQTGKVNDFIEPQTRDIVAHNIYSTKCK